MKAYFRVLAILLCLWHTIVATHLHWATTQALLSSRDVNELDFPCAGHGCGCLNAFQCQTNCCCFKESSPFSIFGNANLIIPKSNKACCIEKELLKNSIVFTAKTCGLNESSPPNFPPKLAKSPLLAGLGWYFKKYPFLRSPDLAQFSPKIRKEHPEKIPIPFTS